MTEMTRRGLAGHSSSLLAFLLGLALSAVAVAEGGAEQAQHLINRMSQASHKLNYEGVFIYHHGQTMETMRIIHKVGENGEQQRLISLTGSAREVIRDNDSVTCIFPDDRAVMVEKSGSRKPIFRLPQPIESVASYYRFSTAGEERVAGRQSWIVNILPADRYRYGYRLWIDQDSYLLLKSELLGNDNDVLEQILFTHLEIRDHIPAAMLEPALTGEDYTWYKNDTSRMPGDAGQNGARWRVTWTPAGFSMQTRSAQSMPMSREPVQHMIYSDGIAVVSVFVEKLDQHGPDNSGASDRGALNTFVRHENGYQITAVGEVPQPTVEGMVNSVVTAD